MNISSFNTILKETNGLKIYQHSNKRKIIELSFFLFFLLIGIILILFGAIFTDQGLFFRISLIVIGSIITVIYLESFLSVLMNKIVISEKGIDFRSYFNWHFIDWKELIAIEYEERRIRFHKSEEQSARITNLEFKLAENKIYLFPIYKFRAKEAEQIVNSLQSIYHEIHGKNPEVSPKIIKELPITDDEINAQIPPKVEDSEIEND
ncbi:MAG: hypothetical protein JXA54_13190 [Candidatus Heimdallarchaeota archaeon]|nr:hypothetical protein [Candidatus Heimdallarchaeota archaeon]